MVVQKTLVSPLDCQEIKPVNPNGNQSWIFTGRTDGGAEAPILWLPDGKNRLTGKDPDPGKDMLLGAAAPLSSKSPWLLPLPGQPSSTLHQAAGPWPRPPPPALPLTSHLLLRLLLQQGPSCWAASFSSSILLLVNLIPFLSLGSQYHSLIQKLITGTSYPGDSSAILF